MSFKRSGASSPAKAVPLRRLCRPLAALQPSLVTSDAMERSLTSSVTTVVSVSPHAVSPSEARSDPKLADGKLDHSVGTVFQARTPVTSRSRCRLLSVHASNHHLPHASLLPPPSCVGGIRRAIAVPNAGGWERLSSTQARLPCGEASARPDAPPRAGG